MNTAPYSGSLTAEQFLFYEIRIASKLYMQGIPADISKIREDNLFQYPTERMISRMTKACYRRLDALNNQMLIQELSSAPVEIAKQINLYAIMRYNRLVWDFMIQVIGEKFRTQDFSFERKDLNTFFSRLQARVGVTAQSVKSRVFWFAAWLKRSTWIISKVQFLIPFFFVKNWSKEFVRTTI